LSTVETPEGLEIYDVGTDYVLGRSRDDLGVERIQMFELPSDLGDRRALGRRP
jgi:hypothetical protein